MISVSGLTFSYKGAPGPALNGVSLTVPEASVYGLLGPSGSGKSTTQKILMGLLVGFGGTATVFGEAPAHSRRSFYERIGGSFELPALYGRLTARENLALFAALFADAPLSPDTVLDMVDLRDAADQRVETFSKGMKMRLNLARALLNDPPLLFLDEPTTGQDPAARPHHAPSHCPTPRPRQDGVSHHPQHERSRRNLRYRRLSCRWPHSLGRPPRRTYGAVWKARACGHRRRNGALTTEHFAMEGLAGNHAFQALLQTGDIVSLHTREASLDDIFVAVAGGGK